MPRVFINLDLDLPPKKARVHFLIRPADIESTSSLACVGAATIQGETK
jgi:hypothetical protein